MPRRPRREGGRRGDDDRPEAESPRRGAAAPPAARRGRACRSGRPRSARSLLAAVVGGVPARCAATTVRPAGRRHRRRGAAAGGRVVRPGRGDGEEHDERVADATDGDPATYWTTETYQAFTKPGVGLVLDAGERASSSQLARDDRHAGLHGRDPRRRLAGGPVRDRRGRASRSGPTTVWDLDGAERALLRRLDHRARRRRARERGRRRS